MKSRRSKKPVTEQSFYSELFESIKKLKGSKVKNLIDNRINEFKTKGKKSDREIFKELCFCILTANFNAEKSIMIQEEVNDGFITLPELQLADKLRKLGHRYPNTRARYIVEARKYCKAMRKIIDSFADKNELREWLVKNVKGIGYKEASHFLRNIGLLNFAIIDFHILDILVKYNLVERPKSLTKRKYLEIENLLKKVAKKLNLSLGELDLYLWYMETGKVLK